MEVEQIQQEIAELEAKIEQDKAAIAEMVGIAVEELDLANVPTEGLNEEQVAEIERLIQEITSLSMQIEAKKEALGNATANAAFREE